MISSRPSKWAAILVGILLGIGLAEAKQNRQKVVEAQRNNLRKRRGASQVSK